MNLRVWSRSSGISMEIKLNKEGDDFIISFMINIVAESSH